MSEIQAGHQIRKILSLTYLLELSDDLLPPLFILWRRGGPLILQELHHGRKHTYYITGKKPVGIVSATDQD